MEWLLWAIAPLKWSATPVVGLLGDVHVTWLPVWFLAIALAVVWLVRGVNLDLWDLPFVGWLAIGAAQIKDSLGATWFLTGLCGWMAYKAASRMDKRLLWPVAFATLCVLVLCQTAGLWCHEGDLASMAGKYAPKIMERASVEQFGGSFYDPGLFGVLIACLAAYVGLVPHRLGKYGKMLTTVSLLSIAGTKQLIPWAALVGTVVLVLTYRNLLAGSRVAVLTLVAVAILTGGYMVKDHPSFRARVGYWRASVEMVKTAPWFGHGWGGWREQYKTLRHEGDEQTKYPHCWPVQVACENGLLAALLLTIVLASVVVRAGMSTAAAACGTVMVAHMLVSMSYAIPAMLLWAMVFLAPATGGGRQR